MATDSDTGTIERALGMIDDLVATVDLVALHASTIRTSVAIVDRVSAADLSRLTPCVGWTLHGLLTHMIAQHYGFAAAARGEDDPEQWKTHPLSDDPAADYRAAADHVLTAFAEPDILNRLFPLAEFAGAPKFPGKYAVSFHFIDYVVHAWDVAKSLGVPVTFDQDLLEAALVVAQVPPGGEARLAAGAAFAPEVAYSGRDRLDEIVAILGRSPNWPN